MRKDDLKPIELLIKTIIVLIAASVIGTALMTVLYCIPDALIINNVNLSAGQIEAENGTGVEEWPLVYSHSWSGKVDSGTDYKNLHDIMRDSDLDPFHRALNGAGYSRYWKGWNGFLRLFMIFFSYGQVRWFVGCLLFILAWMICLKMKERLGTMISFSFLVSLILTNFILVPFSIHMSMCITIALCGTAIVLYRYHRDTNTSSLWYFFLILGILTTYFDELMAPLLTLGMPLLTVLFCDIIDHQKYELKRNFRVLLISSFSWGIGYAVFWAERWGINAIFLNPETNQKTTSTMQYWLGQTAEEGGRLHMLAKNLLSLLPTHGENLVTICTIFTVIIIAMMILIIKKHHSTKSLKSFLPVIIVSLYPFAWYLIMFKHSMVHATLFTYHDLMIC